MYYINVKLLTLRPFLINGLRVSNLDLTPRHDLKTQRLDEDKIFTHIISIYFIYAI